MKENEDRSIEIEIESLDKLKNRKFEKNEQRFPEL